MMALAGVELETLISEPDALTTRPPPKIFRNRNVLSHSSVFVLIFRCKRYGIIML